MIQIALVGNTPIVVEEGLRKSIPEKLYLMHTKDETHYRYETEARKLKKKIEEQFRISVVLIKVDPFDMDENIKAILTIINKERKKPSLAKTDFSINITGGTKLMVAAGSTAAYLAGSKVYYVMDPSKYRGDDLVKELPMPIRPENDDRGNTSKTTAIIIGIIKKLGKCTNGMLLDEVREDRSLNNKKQRIEYHLKKLLEYNLITITVGWEKRTKNLRTGKSNIDYKKRTIRLTQLGEYYAEFPGLMGNLT